MPKLSESEVRQILQDEIKPDYADPNPLLAAYRKIDPRAMMRRVDDPGEHFFVQGDISRLRGALLHEFACGVPTDEAIACIKKHAPAAGVVSIAAGGGYWENLIWKAGVDVVAYDAYPFGYPDSICMNDWYPVRCGDEYSVEQHQDRALFLNWPPGSNPMAARTLSAYTGDVLIYVGERRGGWHANDDFFDMLARDWSCVEVVDLPTWPAPKDCEDKLFIYRRK